MPLQGDRPGGLRCAWQVPLGHRFRHVLSEEEHFSPQKMVEQLRAKGVTVRATCGVLTGTCKDKALCQTHLCVV